MSLQVEALSKQEQHLNSVDSVLEILQKSRWCYQIINFPGASHIQNRSQTVSKRPILLIAYSLPWPQLIMRIFLGVILFFHSFFSSQCRPEMLVDRWCYFRFYNIVKYNASFNAADDFNKGRWRDVFRVELGEAIENHDINRIKEIGNTALSEDVLSEDFFKEIVNKEPSYQHVRVVHYKGAVEMFAPCRTA